MIRNFYVLIFLQVLYSCRAQPVEDTGKWPERDTDVYDSTGARIFPFSVALQHPEKVYRISAVYWNPGNLPSDIDRFVNLKELHVQFQHHTVLPNALWNLKGLTSLSLILDDESQIPEKLGEFSELKNLLLYHSDLPHSIGRLKKLETLTAGYFHQLPWEIWQLTQLTGLSLWGEEPRQLPDEIGNMVHLKNLSICLSNLTALPESIGQLQQLKTLTICLSKLTTLPESVGNLQELETLELTQNFLLKTLPTPVCRLKKLQYLKAYSSAFTSLPPEIGNLSELLVLDIENFSDDTVNTLTQLPPEIGQLSKLNDLILTYHRLESLPKEIGNLKQLRTLKLNHNRLTILPAEIGKMEQLMFLHLNENPLKTLPGELGQLQAINEFEFDTAGIPLPAYPDEVCALHAFPLRLIAKVPKTIAGKPLSQWLKRSDIDTLSRLYVQRQLHMKKKRLTKILDHVITVNPGNEAFYFYLFNELIQYSRMYNNDTIPNAYNTHDLNFGKWDIQDKVIQIVTHYLTTDPCMVFKKVKYGQFKNAYRYWQYYAWLGLGQSIAEEGPKIRKKLAACAPQYLKDWNELVKLFEEMNSVEEGD